MAEKKTTTKKTTDGTKTTVKKTTEKNQKSFLQPLLDYIKKENSKNWRRERVKCLSCGYMWNCIFLNVKGGEYKLQCPKCKKRNSEIVRKEW